MNQRSLIADSVRENYQAGNFIHAVALLNKLVLREPGNAVNLNNLGALHYLCGDDGQAKTYFEKAAQNDAENFAARINLKYLPVNAALRMQFSENTPEIRRASNINPEPVSIVILAYNKWNLTSACLKTLYETTNGFPCEIIVIDNSTDSETENNIHVFRSEKLSYVRNRENVGFARGCNQGAKLAKNGLVLFLNNDTVPLENWLHELVNTMQNNYGAAMAGSKLLYEDHTLQHAGIAFSAVSNMPFHIYRMYPQNYPPANKLRDVQGVTAACMLVRKTVFFDAGMFDERFINGYEDVDLCLKIKRAGHRIMYNPESCLMHLESQSPGRKKYEKENVRLFRRLWEDKIIPDETRYVTEDRTNILHGLGDEDENAKGAHDYGKLLETFHDFIRANPDLMPRLLLTYLTDYKYKKAYRFFYDMARAAFLDKNDNRTRRAFLKCAIKLDPLQAKSYIKMVRYFV